MRTLKKLVETIFDTFYCTIRSIQKLLVYVTENGIVKIEINKTAL